MTAASSLRFRLSAGGALRGTLRVPGDKSISHRAVMLGALAEGWSEVRNFLEGDDTRATAAAFRAMGVTIEADGAGGLRIEGRGLHGLGRPAAPLDLGNSGTAMRLMTGVLAGQAFDSVLVGDASLSARPMGRVVEPLSAMGARIAASAGGTAPLRISGGAPLHGIDYAMPVASAQVKSCLLLAGLYADGETRVVEPAACRDHTERMLESFGYAVDRDGASVALRGGGRLRAATIEVPCDVSSAAFFMVGASIAPDSDLLLEAVGMNPTRAGVVAILQAMGADIEVRDERRLGGEPVADLRVRHAPLHGIDIPAALVPNAIDEFPVIFVAAACAGGRTVLRGARELRVKESDRIGAMASGLGALGAAVTALDDGMIIEGVADPASREPVFGGGLVDSVGDHRIAMALSMAALRCREALVIEDCANVATSFPGYAELAAGAGLRIETPAR